MYQRLRNPAYYRKNQEEYAFYKELIRTAGIGNDLIFDVGANQGQKSEIFSKLAKQVIAFEPSQKLFVLLQKRFRNSNVKLFNYALGSSVAQLDFYEVEGNEAHNSLSKKHVETTVTSRNIATIETVRHKKVKVETLENFITEVGIPGYIKIDVEGYEYEVIKGLNTPVRLISFEANLPEFRDESIQIVEYLASISHDKYKFNFTTDTSFLIDTFVSREEAMSFLSATLFRYLEVYAILYQ